MPVDPEKVCYIYSVLGSCTVEQMGRLAAGTAVVKDWVVIGWANEEGMMTRSLDSIRGMLLDGISSIKSGHITSV